jgi:predicted AlkP superfamily pyrophosphatase or phosphodiesterase
MLTGLAPAQHGVVGNGWYSRDLAEVQFWKQSNHLVHGEKVWETAKRRDASVTCANLFWWYNMYSSADYSVTPRPIYKADGRKLPDVYTEPPDLRHSLQDKLGTFPLFNFWGPMSSIASSAWIAQSAIEVYEQFRPTLNLVYLPHLDYALQKVGPGHASIPHEVQAIDAVVGQLIDHYRGGGVRIIMVSEYGIEGVDDSVHINRHLREAGLLRVREEQGLELLDAGASAAFAVADHQIAHVYVKEVANIGAVAGLCAAVHGVEQVLDRRAQQALGVDHHRAGELLLVSDARHWFSYDYWLDDAKAPDFARTVDIHRKPGYDPAELFLDPAIRFPKAAVGWKLLKRKLGFRALLDVIPLDTSLVRGSHGRVDQPENARPILMTEHAPASSLHELPCQAVRDVILESLFADVPQT